MRDLGLAAIDSHVVFAGMARNDSTNVGLVSTNDNRASLADQNSIRASNFLNSYLERVTDDVKVPRSYVKPIQEGATDWDAGSSIAFGSVYHSKKDSIVSGL